MAADPIDVSADMAEFLLEQKLMERKPVPESKGHCLNCKEPLAPGVKFCDADCRDDWQLAQDATKRNAK